MLNIIRSQAYRFAVDSSTSYAVTFFSKDEFSLDDEAKYLQEKSGQIVKDYEDTYTAQSQPGSWSILFKYVLHFRNDLCVRQMIQFAEPTFLSASLYLPDYAQQYGNLRMIDNDTFEVVPQVFYNLKARTYLPNKVRNVMFLTSQNGYTLIAELKTPQPRPAGKFKIRVISEPALVPSPERPLDYWTKAIVQDFEEVFSPNKHNILFRSSLKVKDGAVNPASLQVTFSFSDLWIRLQLFDNDIEVFSYRGRGIVTVPLFLFYSSDDGKPAEKPKDDKTISVKDKMPPSQVCLEINANVIRGLYGL